MSLRYQCLQLDSRSQPLLKCKGMRTTDATAILTYMPTLLTGCIACLRWFAPELFAPASFTCPFVRSCLICSLYIPSPLEWFVIDAFALDSFRAWLVRSRFVRCLTNLPLICSLLTNSLSTRYLSGRGYWPGWQLSRKDGRGGIPVSVIVKYIHNQLPTIR